MFTNELFGSIVTVATAIVGVAIIAVIVSNRSQTAQVIESAGGAFSNALGAAVSPVTGGGYGMHNTSFGFTGGAPVINF